MSCSQNSKSENIESSNLSNQCSSIATKPNFLYGSERIQNNISCLSATSIKTRIDTLSTVEDTAAAIIEATSNLSSDKLIRTNVDNKNVKTNFLKTIPATPPSSPVTEDSDIYSNFGAGKVAIAIQLHSNKQNKNIEICANAAIMSSSTTKSGNDRPFPSPSMLRKSSDSSSSLAPRRVSFPKSDAELVTGYLEPANPWEQACMVKNTSDIIDEYEFSCQKHNTKPLQTILDHLKVVELNKQLRQPLLSLKSIKLQPADCEALEEVFKRVQYKAVDISSCDLNEISASALFDIFQYYEATTELDVSSNADGMTNRGWLSCTCLVRNCQALQVLNAEGNPISKSNADSLGVAMITSNLHTLKLEHCGLRGAPLNSLCFKLRNNRILKELWLAYNNLETADAGIIADLLRYNHYLELLDISNNNIKDDGLRVIVEAIIVQSQELERRSMFQRSAAIDDDESLSPVEATPPVNAQNINITSNNKMKDNTADNVILKKEDTYSNSVLPSDLICTSNIQNSSFENKDGKEQPHFPESTVAIDGTNLKSTEDIDCDDDTENTVRSITTKNLPTTSGQSMLDKLLSMNSDSSSEEGASNISTDTIAACCSEDTSIISDDIFEAQILTTTSTSMTAKTTIRDVLLPPSLCTSVSSSTNVPVDHQLHRNRDSSDIFYLTKATNSDSNSDSNSSLTTISLNSNVNNTNTTSNNNTISSNSNSNSNGHQCNQNSSHQSLLRFGDNNECGKRSSESIYEVKAEESDCLISVGLNSIKREEHNDIMQHSTKAVDMKSTKLGEDYDDTHSTDSAFESASEGDISRHLPDEFNRLSVSFDSTRLDDIGKELLIETGTIASESTECLIDAPITPSSTPSLTPAPLSLQLDDLPNQRNIPTPNSNISKEHSVDVDLLALSITPSIDSALSTSRCESNTDKMIINPLNSIIQPKVKISEESLLSKEKEIHASPNPTPPPPSTSPGSVNTHINRNDTTCSFITQSTRNRSQSSDSLCSDNSLDGSIGSDISFSTPTQLNEKLTKNDTLTRQQKPMDPLPDTTTRAPGGLKALAVWNNNLTKESGLYISDLLAEPTSLELLNIGKNCLSNEFVFRMKDSLMKNTTLNSLGLQSAHLSTKGIETLSSILNFGGNSTLQRIDIRDNKVDVESLATLADSLKSNTTVTQIDIDDEPKRLSFEKLRIVPVVSVTPPMPAVKESVVSSDAHIDYARLLQNVRSMCSRNEKTQSQLLADKAANPMGGIRRQYGFYVGCRKISLTCHSRPHIDTNMVVTAPATSSGPVNKLEIKRKPGTRLRSPAPSPPTISPSSSPNRSRFQVFRVNEVSPMTSPLAQTSPPPHPSNSTTSISISSSNVSILTSTDNHQMSLLSSLPISSSLPLMSTITSSTQSIKRTMSPRSRFHVCKIYEDPKVPLTKRSLPPITPPHNSSLTSMFTPSKTDVKDIVIEAPLCYPSNNELLQHQSKVIKSTATISSSSLNPLTPSSGTPQSSLSSSSSSSPASITSISSSSSSSPSTAVTSASDNPDSTSETSTAELLPAIENPIAVFGDNEITLTKTSTNDVLKSTAVSTLEEKIKDIKDINEKTISTEDKNSIQTLQPRVRKTSWIANPTPVDKLLNLFQNPSTFFQRSGLSETKLSTTSFTDISGNTINPNIMNNAPISNQQDENNLLLSTRKNSPPAWTKLGTDLLNSTNSENNANVSMSTAVAAAATIEQSRSFIDAASRQLRDFGKQVFKPNLSFGNETNSSPHAILEGVASGGMASPDHISAHIPSNVKQEIKENISPEHTINEGTLQTLQKLGTVNFIAQAEDYASMEVFTLEQTITTENDEFKSELSSSINLISGINENTSGSVAEQPPTTPIS